MRKPRVLAARAWDWVTTAVNRHEPVFLERNAVSLFNRVFREAECPAVPPRHPAKSP
jgi:hypothetical protein